MIYQNFFQKFIFNDKNNKIKSILMNQLVNRVNLN